jgi:GGDEF domain-containing protein
MEEKDRKPEVTGTREDSPPLPRLALDWLREVLRSEFADAPDFERARDAALAGAQGGGESASGGARGGGVTRIPERLFSRDPFDVAARYARGEVENALWYRDWHRRWRRLQLPHRLQGFLLQLDRARTAEEVYRTLTEHAVQIVGGYTSLLFPPQEEAPLRALPNPLLRVDAGRLTISVPLTQPGLIARDDVFGEGNGPLASLAPLFSEERAVSLAHAPLGEGGVILVVERRQERVFEQDDWDLLRLLSAHASAALTRVRTARQINELRETHATTALPAPVQAEPVLERALEVARQGEPLTLAAIRLDGLEQIAAEDGEAAADRVRRTAAEVLRELSGSLGIAVQQTADEYLLVLPRLTRAQAENIVGRLARQLPARVPVRVGLAEYTAEISTPRALIAGAQDELTQHAVAAARLTI